MYKFFADEKYVFYPRVSRYTKFSDVLFAREHDPPKIGHIIVKNNIINELPKEK